MRAHSWQHRPAFSLIELLAALAAVSLLIGLLLPALGSARDAARRAACGSALRQLGLCVSLYAGDAKGLAPAGAPNFLANRLRWFGSRPNATGTFSSEGGTLSAYLDPAVTARTCPNFAGTLSSLADRNAGFERGCGGFGYNNTYLGSQRARTAASPNAPGRPPGFDGALITDRLGQRIDAFPRPTDIISFADAAFAADELIEYSFVEPRFLPQAQPGAQPSTPPPGNLPSGTGDRSDPSIHFRHGGPRSRAGAVASIAFLDGHIAPERRTMTWSSGLYTADPDPLNLGWFGAFDDNRDFGG